MLNQLNYGPKFLYGQQGGCRGDRSAALVTTDGHARFQEAVYQGNVYAQATAAAGVTCSGTTVISAGTAQPVIGLYNPLQSGKLAVIWAVQHMWSTGTPGAGGLAYGMGSSKVAVLVTGAPTNTQINCGSLATGGSAMQTYVNAAMTGSGTPTIMGYGGGPGAFALAAGAPFSYFDWIDGKYVVPQGSYFVLTNASTGSSPVISATLYWEEIPAI